MRQVVGSEGFVGRLPHAHPDRARGVDEHLRNVGQRHRCVPGGDDQRIRLRPQPPQGDLHGAPGLLPADPGDRLALAARSAASACRRSAARASTSTEQPREISVRCGVIIIATGYDPYEPLYGEFGYGVFPKVITLQQLIRLLDPEGPTGGRLVAGGPAAQAHCVHPLRGGTPGRGRAPAAGGRPDQGLLRADVLHGGASRGADDQGTAPGDPDHGLLPGHPDLRPRARAVLRARVGSRACCSSATSRPASAESSPIPRGAGRWW